ETLQIAQIYEKYSDLFERSTIERLVNEFEQTPAHFENARRSLQNLQIFSIEQYLEDSVKRLTEEINDCESSATIEWNGHSMTFHDSAVALASEPDRTRRQAIHAKREAIIRNSNDLREERIAKLHEAARLLGRSGYKALYESLRRIDYSKLA